MNQNQTAVIRESAEAMRAQLTEWYHDLHRIPEMAHHEIKTNQ